MVKALVLLRGCNIPKITEELELVLCYGQGLHVSEEDPEELAPGDIFPSMYYSASHDLLVEREEKSTT